MSWVPPVPWRTHSSRGRKWIWKSTYRILSAGSVAGQLLALASCNSQLFVSDDQLGETESSWILIGDSQIQRSISRKHSFSDEFGQRLCVPGLDSWRPASQVRFIALKKPSHWQKHCESLVRYIRSRASKHQFLAFFKTGSIFFSRSEIKVVFVLKVLPSSAMY